MPDHIDVKIKSWGNGSTSGPWIKLDLAEEEDLEALKSHIGKGFHMFLVPIDNGDGDVPVLKEKPKQTGKKGLKLSNEAYFMVKGPSFREYLYSINGFRYMIDQADDWLKDHCGITSKSELDKGFDDDPHILKFLHLQSDWRKWVNK